MYADFLGKVGPVFWVLFLCRVPLLLTVISSIVLYQTSQGMEVVRTVALETNGFYVLIYVTGFIFSICCWRSCRLLVNLVYQPGKLKTYDKPNCSRNAEEMAVVLVPRIMGLLPLLGLSAALFLLVLEDSGTYWKPFAFTTLTLLAAAILIFFRRKLMKKFEIATTDRPMIESTGIGFAQVLFWGTLLIAAAVCVRNIFHPTFAFKFAGTVGAMFLAGTVIVAFLSGAIYILEAVNRWGNAGKLLISAVSVPVVTLFSLVFVVVGMFGNAYEVRKLELSSAAHGPDSRSDLSEVWNAWYKQNGKKCNYKPVIVAAAGGASRAALWTGTVLGVLAKKDPKFRDCLFAISSVSGGTLGATAFVAGVKESRSTTELQNFLKSDFLGPVISGMLINDGIFAGLHWWGIKTRADALEESWEEAWAATSASKKSMAFSADFTSLWERQQQWPILFINGTHTQTGRRIITSNIQTAGLFNDAHDFYKEVRSSPIRVSTAVHNSARFTIISPGGKLTEANALTPDLRNRGHIIDGGYFENYGAQTANELISRIKGIDQNVKFIRVQITSDPALEPTIFASSRCGQATGPIKIATSSSEFGNFRESQYLIPALGLMQTREARGIHASMDFVCSGGADSYFHFPIKRNSKAGVTEIDPVLSWALSPAVVKFIENTDSYREFDRVTQALNQE